MSPRKLTEDDKQEILQQYRNSEATTSTLANRYEVSSSTISRFLKNQLSSTEYEDLIQQKRLARTPRGEKTKSKKEKTTKTRKTRKKSTSKVKSEPIETSETIVEAPNLELTGTESSEPETVKTKTDSQKTPTRRRRRRSSAKDNSEMPEGVNEIEVKEQMEAVEPEEKPNKLIIDKQILETANIEDSEKTNKSNSLILKGDKPNVVNSSNLDPEEEEDDDDDDELDLITLKEMLGEDLEDINDEEDDEDEDVWEDDSEAIATYPRKERNFSDIEILPLSQATFPRICYLVIDRSAELIVKPLAEFADLGDIPQDEVRERTLPVFDNHRIAKRFSHRRERVIKVPDGRMLQKTSRYLEEKGITRLLMDGQIYSLSR